MEGIVINIKYIASYWSKKLFNNFIFGNSNAEITLPDDILSKIKLALKQRRIVVINYLNNDGDYTSISGKINRFQIEKNLLIIETLNQQITLIKLTQIKKIRLLPKDVH